ncbi:MAG: hypothetical protein KAS38_18830 [Anaerolineales bacterium]|nr:hypothetical protein [Anaerolineales bacterium]
MVESILKEATVASGFLVMRGINRVDDRDRPPNPTAWLVWLSPRQSFTNVRNDC